MSEKILEKKLSEKGFIIQKSESKKSLSYISLFIKKSILKHHKNDNLKKNFSFDKLHNFIEINKLNSLRLKIISDLNNDPKFRQSYFRIAEKTLYNLVGIELSMQNNINLSSLYFNNI